MTIRIIIIPELSFSSVLCVPSRATLASEPSPFLFDASPEEREPWVERTPNALSSPLVGAGDDDDVFTEPSSRGDVFFLDKREVVVVVVLVVVVVGMMLVAVAVVVVVVVVAAVVVDVAVVVVVALAVAVLVWVTTVEVEVVVVKVVEVVVVVIVEVKVVEVAKTVLVHFDGIGVCGLPSPSLEAAISAVSLQFAWPLQCGSRAIGPDCVSTALRQDM